MSRHPYLLLIYLAFVVTFALMFLQLPGNTLLWRAIQNSGHTLIFAILSATVLVLLMKLENIPPKSALILCCSSLFVLGILIEFGQHLTGRGASVDDLTFNSAGIVVGCGLAIFSLPSTKSIFSYINKWLIAIAGGVAIAWSLKWPAIYLFAGLLRPSSPILADFENAGTHHFISGNGSSSNIVTYPSWKRNPSRSLQVQFDPGRLPSVQFLEPMKNWSDFSQLTFDVFNAAEQPMQISLRIDDQTLGPHNEDHMTVARIVPEGGHHVVINFEDFKADAIQRNRPGLASFKNIRSFMVFVGTTDVRATLYFDNFALREI